VFVKDVDLEAMSTSIFLNDDDEWWWSSSWWSSSSSSCSFFMKLTKHNLYHTTSSYVISIH